MSGGRMRLHGVMQREAGQWNIWCPELDLMTCGDHADHAVAMLEDAIRCCIPEDLSLWCNSVDVEGERPMKRVHHPKRRAERSHEDELFPIIDDYINDRGNWKHQAMVELRHLDRDVPAPIAMASGDMWWNCRSGILSLDVSMHDWIWVPARRFRGLALQKHEREIKADVPSCLLDCRSPLDVAREYITEGLYRGQELYQWSLEEVMDVE